MTIQNNSNAIAHNICDTGVLRGSLGLAIFTLIVLGLLYPLAGVGLGQMLFPSQANGSLLIKNGKVLGSELAAQPFESTRYFQPRPSAVGYDPMAVAGSNQARTNADLRQRIAAARTKIAQRNDVQPAAVPSDLMTQSGGGIDPHISPQAAVIQAARVAQVRGIDIHVVKKLIAQYTETPQLGVLGQARVNVLKLNLALDALVM